MQFTGLEGVMSVYFCILEVFVVYEEVYLQDKEKDNFLATYDPVVYSHADVIIVDINLDVVKKPNNDLY